MFKKILYPTDFSESARAALLYVKKLKDAGTEQVIILHVYDERNIEILWDAETFINETEDIEKARHKVVKKMLEKNYKKLKELENELKATGLKVELIVKEGIPYREIIETASDLHVSLIVMGSHGERGVIKEVIGSTTGKVLKTASVPVLVVRVIDNTTHEK